MVHYPSSNPKHGRETPPIAYLAGPMRGCPDFNFPAFDAARERLEAAGYDVISPADLDRFLHVRAEVFDTATGTFKGDPTPIILRDLVTLTSLQPGRDDCVALLPGWAQSVGARCEVALAIWKGLRFIDAIRLNEVYPFLRGNGERSRR